MNAISNQSFSINGVKEAGTNSGEGLSPGSCLSEQQGGPSCHRTTSKGGKRIKWSQEINQSVIECYYNSRSSRIYIENAYDLEIKRNLRWKRTTIVGSKVADCHKKWFSDLE